MTTVDLCTGDQREPHREDYATKRGGAEPGGECPRWRQFLGEITGHDAQLQGYLQRMAGYCLTGITTEHILFFAYGSGANGKSVFINTLAGVWGDYAVTAPMETFIASRNERHPTDLAMLRGARLVIAQEIDPGRKWAESKIKTLTGGERQSGRGNPRCDPAGDGDDTGGDAVVRLKPLQPPRGPLESVPAALRQIRSGVDLESADANDEPDGSAVCHRRGN